MNSSKPSILKQSRFVSGSDTMNRGRWSDMGGWAGGGVSDCDMGGRWKRRKREGRERGKVEKRECSADRLSTLDALRV